MLSFLTAVGIFGFFTVVGCAAIVLAERHVDGPRFLISPAIGVAVTLIPVETLNAVGVPIAASGTVIAILLLASSLWIVVKRVRVRIFRWDAAIALGLLASAILAGWPMFDFGSNWLSYMNGDTNTYAEGALRFLHQGFSTPPQLVPYVDQRAGAEQVYGLDVLFNNRSGTENILAFWAAVFHESPYRLYMAAILAGHVVLIAAAASLAARINLRAAFAATLLLAVSPLNTLGIESELYPQVLGLSLLAATFLLVTLPIQSLNRRALIARSLVTGAALAAFLAIYPEISPIFVLAVIAYFGVAALRRDLPLRRTGTLLAASAAACAVFLNAHISTFLEMLVVTLSFGGGTHGLAQAFPYFLVPSGLGQLFGFGALGVTQGPWIVTGTIAGALLLLTILAAIGSLAVRGKAVAFPALAFALAAIPLFKNDNGFGLYKLAMYVQPFVVPALASWWETFGRPQE